MDGCVFAVQKTLLPSFHPMPTLRSALPPKPAALASSRLICSKKTCCKSPLLPFLPHNPTRSFHRATGAWVNRFAAPLSSALLPIVVGSGAKAVCLSRSYD
jgi:hypothetical protein